MDVPRIATMLSDPDLSAELQNRLSLGNDIPKMRQWNMPAEAARKVVGATASGGEEAAPAINELDRFSEAVVLEFGRPSLLVRNDTFDIPVSDTWAKRLNPARGALNQVIRSVGRVELLGHDSYPWAGTAWMIAEDVAVTNRHVALIFAERTADGFTFSRNTRNKAVRARIDFKEEVSGGDVAEIEVKEIIFIEDPVSGKPDMAFLRLAKDANLPPPIPLLEGAVEPGTEVAAIGYPARDDRHDDRVLLDVFGDIYNVKRLAPGTITASGGGFDFILSHDCSTLTGSSGSVIVDLVTRRAVGLHFGGQPRFANYAVRSGVLLKVLHSLEIKTFVTRPIDRSTTDGVVGSFGDEEARRPEDYADREGYLDNFLGRSSALLVPLPQLRGEAEDDVAEVEEDDNRGIGPNGELRYTHFSVVMSRKRRLPIFTAVNIDGSQLKRIPRGSSWRYDPRIDQDLQVGEEVYGHPKLDRGHMVRRLDPVWGSDGEARQANSDTFHYTNACPQVNNFNSGTWNDLEDYVLNNSGDHRLRVSVFTGPVFGDDDEDYKGAQVPKEFWKVAVTVMGRGNNRRLSATAYMQSQANLVPDLEESFTFGQFRTYQVPLRRIEKLTHLDFGDLRVHDPLDDQETIAAREIRKPEDVQF